MFKNEEIFYEIDDEFEVLGDGFLSKCVCD